MTTERRDYRTNDDRATTSEAPTPVRSPATTGSPATNRLPATTESPATTEPTSGESLPGRPAEATSSPDLADFEDGYTARDRRVGTAPDRITVQPRPGGPARIHVRVGDVVYEGDPRKLRRIGGRTPRIDAWKVVDVAPDRVTARHVDTGVEFDWDRAALETGLLTGRYAVDLVEFVAVGVRRNYPGRGRPDTVIVTAYGNDGLRYVRRFVVLGETDGAVRVAPWTETPAVSGLPASLRRALDRRVATALENDGYVLD